MKQLLVNNPKSMVQTRRNLLGKIPKETLRPQTVLAKKQNQSSNMRVEVRAT